MKGSRVQNVVQELRGEKIDIIPWHIDPARFVCNALAPAQVSRVIIDEENRSMEVIVPDEHLSIAIGKRGQNVRLASKLTKWHLDVTSEERYSKAMQAGYNSLVCLPEVGAALADALYEKGFYSAAVLAAAAPEDLLQVREMTEERAVQLIADAKGWVAANPILDEQEGEEPETESAEGAPPEASVAADASPPGEESGVSSAEETGGTDDEAHG
jgi:N utilization substance protein A